METYKLNKETKGKKYLYTVTDESGNVISTRTSARDYVACTINGEFYFGRLDLIGKGDHGRSLSYITKSLLDYEEAYKSSLKYSIPSSGATQRQRMAYERLVFKRRLRLEERKEVLSTIAYL